MNTEQLKRGIAMLFDMEMNNYMMTKTINDLNTKIKSLGHPAQFESPVEEEKISFSIWRTIMVAVIVGIVFFLICVFYNAAVDSVDSVESGLAKMKASFFTGLIAGAVCDTIIQFIKVSKQNNQVDEWYQSDLTAFAKARKDDEIRVKNEMAQKEFLMSERQALIKKKEDSISKTERFYDSMNIDPNYRNLIPIGYMHDYIKLGIATKLEGVDGLYNLVRKELRQDQFMCKLDEISHKLSQIVDNQHAIYMELVKMNSSSRQLVQSVVNLSGKISQNTSALNELSAKSDIAVYNLERGRKELEYQGFMKSIGMY